MLMLYSNNYLKLLIFSDSKDSTKTIKRNISNTKYSVMNVDNLDDFKTSFVEASVVIIDIENMNLYKEVIIHIKFSKKKQYILSCVEENNYDKLYIGIKGRVDEIIFKPHDFYALNKKINRYYREAFLLKEIFKIKSLEKKELELEQKKFFESIKPMIEKHRHAYVYVLEESKEKIIQLINLLLRPDEFANSHKFMVDTLFQFISDIFSYENFNARRAEIKLIGEELLKVSENSKVEDSIYGPIIKKVLFLLEEKYSSEKWFEELQDNITVLFEFEIKLMGLNLKYTIQRQTADKESHLQINSLHLLMSSTSHLQNNMLSTVKLRSRKIDKLLTLGIDDESQLTQEQCETRKKIYKSLVNGTKPLVEYVEFINKTSTLFCTFKYEDEISNVRKVDFLFFVIELVFVHGFNIKHGKTNLTVSVRDEIRKENILLYENILIASMYAVLENAIQAEAKNIEIYIEKNGTESIDIVISNDGNAISNKEQKKLFRSFFGTKGLSGLGLPIAYKWLKDINYILEFRSSREERTSFCIKIPQEKDKN